MVIFRFKDVSINKTKSDYTRNHRTKKYLSETGKGEQKKRYKHTTKKVEQKKDPRDQRAYSYII